MNRSELARQCADLWGTWRTMNKTSLVELVAYVNSRWSDLLAPLGGPLTLEEVKTFLVFQ